MMYKKIVFFDELSVEAKEEAREWYRRNDDMPFLEELLTEYVKDKLEEAGYTVSELKLAYSLSYCQGDGLSFSCNLEKDGKNFFVMREGHHYYHANTMSAFSVNEDEEDEEDASLLEEMKEIARAAGKAGYEEIEYQGSDECIDETMKANEYTFTIEGKRMDYDVEI